MRKNNRFIKKYKIYIIIGVLFAVWVGFVFFIIRPSIKLLRGDFDAVQMKLIQQQVNSEKINKISNLREQFENVDGERHNLEVIFSKNNIVELAKELESIAQKTGNTIAISVNEDEKALVQVSKERAGTNSKENEFLKNLPTKNYLIMKIRLEGDYNSLVDFVGKLNKVKYYNSVASLKLIAEKIAIKDESKVNVPSGGISIMNGNNTSAISTESEKEKLVLNSDLDVIFYSLENNEESK